MTDTREKARNSAWECIYHLWNALKSSCEADIVSIEKYNRASNLFYELKEEYFLEYGEEWRGYDRKDVI